jgi:adenosine 3'-phospho 5'-phosphosulfate transporter B2
MLTGRVLFGKQYSLTEYVSVSIIAVGIFFFSDVNNIEGANKIIKTTLPGFICLLGYLVSDSFTSTWQDNLIKSFSMSSIALMFMTNLYSCLFTFVSLLSQGELNETIEFMKEHSDITYHLCYLSLASAIGQIFIFVTIQRFGALVFTLIMTTRQVLSILFSALIFQHQLSLQSVFGIFLIFSALFIQQFIKIANKYNFKKPLKSEKIII